MLILSSLLIAFTPLRGLVPGFIKPELQEEAIRNAQIIDSLEVVINQHEQHIKIIQDVINGKTIATAESSSTETVNEQEVVYRRSREDSLLRVKVEKRLKEQQQKEKNKTALSAPKPSMSYGDTATFSRWKSSALEATLIY